jgi:hypothetical protein
MAEQDHRMEPDVRGNPDPILEKNFPRSLPFSLSISAIKMTLRRAQ